MQIFDLHNDTFTELFDLHTTLDDTRLSVNTYGLKQFRRSVCSYAVWLSGNEISPIDRYRRVLQNGKQQLNDNGIGLCLTADDLLSRERHLALLSLEGGAVIDSVERVNALYNDGIRTVSLTWNYDNHLAGGALENGSLTTFGAEVIKGLNEYNIALDLSHLNRKSFFDALKFTKFPLVTHAGLSFLVENKRNLTDEQVRAVSQKGGLIGLCFYNKFIGPKNVTEGFLRAVDSLLSLGCEDNIAIGSDFDGALMDLPPKNLAEMPTFYEKCKNCFGQVVTDKLFFYNSYNFYVNVLTNKKK